MKHLAAVVLAAGLSQRFGADKLRAELNGKPVLQHVLDGLAPLGLGEVVVVSRTSDVPNAVINPRPEDGMGTSLALGVATLKPCLGVFIVLGDMPMIDADLYRNMADGLAGVDIVVPVHGRQNGHPVLFGTACFVDLKALSGDTGARQLLRSGRYKIRLIEAGAHIHADIDTPADLTLFAGRTD